MLRSKIWAGLLDSKAVNVNVAFQKVYKAAQEALSESSIKLKLKGIDLAFITTTTIDANGGINFWVITEKYSVSKANSIMTTYKFGKIEQVEKASTPDASIKDFKNYLLA